MATKMLSRTVWSYREVRAGVYFEVIHDNFISPGIFCNVIQSCKIEPGGYDICQMGKKLKSLSIFDIQ